MYGKPINSVITIQFNVLRNLIYFKNIIFNVIIYLLDVKNNIFDKKSNFVHIFDSISIVLSLGFLFKILPKNFREAK